MSNFLSNLVKNNLDPAPSLVQPRLPSLFEPATLSEEPMLVPEQQVGPVVEMEQKRPATATNQRPVTPPIPSLETPPPPTEPAPGQPFRYQPDQPVAVVSVPHPSTPAPQPSEVPIDEQPNQLAKPAPPVEPDRATSPSKPKPVASPSLIEPVVTRLPSPPDHNRSALPATEIAPSQPNDMLHQPLSPTPGSQSPVEPVTIEIRPESSKPGPLPGSSPRRRLNDAPSMAAGQPAWSNVPWEAAPDSPAPPTINVRIGRIEVKAALPAKSKPAKSSQATPVMSLEQYLRRRNGGGDR